MSADGSDQTPMRQRYTVSIDVDVDVRAWQYEYGGGDEVAIGDVAVRLADWARERHYTEPMWDGFVTAKAVHVRRQGEPR